MCNICLDLENGKLTVEEARRASFEMVLSVEDEYSEEMNHYLDLYAKMEEEEKKNPVK